MKAENSIECRPFAIREGHSTPQSGAMPCIEPQNIKPSPTLQESASVVSMPQRSFVRRLWNRFVTFVRKIFPWLFKKKSRAPALPPPPPMQQIEEPAHSSKKLPVVKKHPRKKSSAPALQQPPPMQQIEEPAHSSEKLSVVKKHPRLSYEQLVWLDMQEHITKAFCCYFDQLMLEGDRRRPDEMENALDVCKKLLDNIILCREVHFGEELRKLECLADFLPRIETNESFFQKEQQEQFTEIDIYKNAFSNLSQFLLKVHRELGAYEKKIAPAQWPFVLQLLKVQIQLVEIHLLVSHFGDAMDLNDEECRNFRDEARTIEHTIKEAVAHLKESCFDQEVQAAIQQLLPRFRSQRNLLSFCRDCSSGIDDLFRRCKIPNILHSHYNDPIFGDLQLMSAILR